MTVSFEELYTFADRKGKEAAEVCSPTPMAVGQAKSLFSNEIDRSKPVYIVEDGPCGFAWVWFKGNTAWGRWAKKQGHAKNHYPKGLYIWVSGYNQSIQRKEAYAQAFAKVLRENGVTDAYADSRLD